jgi:hypothetical protein
MTGFTSYPSLPKGVRRMYDEGQRSGFRHTFVIRFWGMTTPTRQKNSGTVARVFALHSVALWIRLGKTFREAIGPLS